MKRRETRADPLPVVPNNRSDVTSIGFPQTSPATFAGAVFTPNTPAQADVVYFGSDNSTWIFKAGQYQTYTPPASTEWAFPGTLVDAGGNKVSTVQRQGAILVGAPTTTALPLVSSATKAIFANELAAGAVEIDLRALDSTLGTAGGGSLRLSGGALPAIEIVNRVAGGRARMRTKKLIGASQSTFDLLETAQVQGSGYTGQTAFNETGQMNAPLGTNSAGGFVSSYRLAGVAQLSGGQVLNGYSSYQDFNGGWVSPITLPAVGRYPGDVFMLDHQATTDTVVSIAGTDMTAPFVATATNRGGAWLWNNGKWNLLNNVPTALNHRFSGAASEAFGINDLVVSIGAAAGASPAISLPNATLWANRIVTVRLSSDNFTAKALAVTSAGGTVGSNDGAGRALYTLKSEGIRSATWISDGVNWQMIAEYHQMFTSTDKYLIPSGVVVETLNAGIGSVQPLGHQPNASTTHYNVIDGNYAGNVQLNPNPTANTFSLWTNNSAGFNTTIRKENTDLPHDVVVVSGSGRSIHFVWHNGLWRWNPKPEYTPISRAGIRSAMASAQGGTTQQFGEFEFRYSTNATGGGLEIRSISGASVSANVYAEKRTPTSANTIARFVAINLTVPVTFVAAPVGAGAANTLISNEIAWYEIHTILNSYTVKLKNFGDGFIHLLVEKNV
jgi:hypothetical protein